MTKHCSKCNTTKPKKLFSKNKIRSDGLQSECKGCRAIYLQKHYAKNKAYYKSAARRKQDELLAFVAQIKESNPCMDCGKSYRHYVMDYDHRDPTEKCMCIANMIQRKNKKQLLAEIAKCDLVCSNCHRERTFGPISSAPKQVKG